MNLHGIIPPLVTPMTADESIDLAGLKRHIDWQIACGVHAVFVLGTTGEFYSLDDAEKQSVVSAAMEHVAGRVPVLVGTGAVSTREVLKLTRMAEREKAAGVSVITPFFIKPNQNELHDHYKRIAESTPLPVVLYSNPSTCGGLTIEPDTVARLAQVKNIIGVKDSSGDLEAVLEILRLVPPTFKVLMGRDTLIYPALACGAAGAIPASCNMAPELCVGIYESFRQGDLAAARTFQARLHPVRTALALGTANASVKAGMALRGRGAGPSRSPISPLSEDKKAKLAALLEAAGLMK